MWIACSFRSLEEGRFFCVEKICFCFSFFEEEFFGNKLEGVGRIYAEEYERGRGGRGTVSFVVFVFFYLVRTIIL